MSSNTDAFFWRLSKRISIALTIAMVIFLVLSIINARHVILGGINLTPFNVLVVKKNSELVPDNFKVSVVTKWSVLELVRLGDRWSIPSDRIVNVPSLRVEFPPGEQSGDYEFYYSTSESVDHQSGSPSESDLHKGWKQLALKNTSLQAADLEKGAALVTEDPENSILLNLVGLKLLNWRGDFQFALKTLMFPLLIVGFPLLVFFGMEKQRSAVAPKLSSIVNSQRIEGLDHLRGLAILLVFGFHCLYAVYGYSDLGWDGWFRDFNHSNSFLALTVFSFGWGGVAIFFALSGFCIHLSYERSNPKGIGPYAVRRFFRIYPPFLAALLFFAILFPPTKLAFESIHDYIQLFSRVFMVHNLHPSTFWGINGVFWSVAVEVQLYFIYPLLLLGSVLKFGWNRTIFIACILELFLRSYVWFFGIVGIDWELSYIFTQGPLAYLFSWGIGAKLASDMLASRKLFLSNIPLSFWLGMLFVSLFFEPMNVFAFPLFSLCTVSWIARSLTTGKYLLPLPKVLNDHLQWVGLISYSLYLLHQPFVNLAPVLLQSSFPGEFIHPVYKLLACFAMYPLILFMSWLLHRFVELPSIDAGKWLIRTKLSDLDRLAKVSTG